MAFCDVGDGGLVGSTELVPFFCSNQHCAACGRGWDHIDSIDCNSGILYNM